MLYEAIRLGCEMYHKNGRSYDKAYHDYLKFKNRSKWADPIALDYDEVDRLIYFANQWKTMMPRDDKNVRLVRDGLKRAIRSLDSLNGMTLLNIRFDQSVRELISSSFEEIAKSGRRYEVVATSKMLHTAINPEVFVMWDSAIMFNYGPLQGNGLGYADSFLPRMQELSEEAIRQVVTEEGLSRDDAIKSLTPCGNTLAKVIDEFNFAKFTLKNNSVLEVESRT